jgi:hypothetical protein
MVRSRVAGRYRWNGTRWATVSSPNDNATHGSDLNAVSCTSTTFCMAVGSFWNGTVTQNWTEKWNGPRWAKVTVPDTSSTEANRLYGVSCTSATCCLAVGLVSTGTESLTLAEKWNGSSWTVVTSPDPTAHLNNLFGVSCTSKTFCMTAGSYYTGSFDQTLIERW